MRVPCVVITLRRGLVRPVSNVSSSSCLLFLLNGTAIRRKVYLYVLNKMVLSGIMGSGCLNLVGLLLNK